MSLNRERVLEEAVCLADEEGLAKLSMRRLAKRLGIEAMSLYHHVPNKDAILDGMVDHVFAEMELPEGPDWRAAVLRRSDSARAALARHPWAIGLLESRENPGMATLIQHDAIIGCLTRAGFSVPLTAHAVAVIDSYVYGFALQERNLPFDQADGAAELAVELLTPEVVAAFPHLARLATEHVMQPGYDFGDEFAWGLQLILDGLERRLHLDSHEDQRGPR